MSNPIFITPELSDAATITASSEALGLPVTNLQKMQPTEVWQTATLSGVSIDIDLGSVQTYDTVALLFSNVSDVGTWRVRCANTQATLSLSPSYDSTLAAYQSPQRFIKSDGGYLLLSDGSGILLDSFVFTDLTFVASPTRDVRRHSFLYVPATITSRWLRIEITDPTNAAGFIRAGRLYVGKSWQPTRNFDYGLAIGFTDMSDIGRSRYGQQYPRSVDPIPYVEGRLSYLTEAESMSDLYELLRTRGASRDVLVCTDTTQDANLHKRILCGLLGSDLGMFNRFYGRFEKTIRVNGLV